MSVGVPVRLFPYGEPLAEAELKRSPQDFIVTEIFDFPLLPLDAQAEHLALRIRKTGQNSQWVAERLAEHYGLRRVDVGYAGKKDRHAVTEQWFSLYVSNAELPSLPIIEGCEIVEVGRTTKKIRLGDHQGNHFQIALYIKGDIAIDQIEQRSALISAKGFANYFGNQRFGINGNNVARFDDAVLNDRKLRRSDKGIILSSARSAIFNRLLSLAIEHQHDATTLPLWGRGRSDEWALQNLGPFDHWRDRLEHSGLSMDDRQMMVSAKDLSFRIGSTTDEQGEAEVTETKVEFNFALPPGAYATTLLEHYFDLVETPKYSTPVV